MFRHLRTKLTVLYAGLFAASLVLIASLALAAMSDNAQRVVRKELATSSRVFQQVWAQRAAQLDTDAVLLAHDFGFRTAVASGDIPTIRSALDNLKQRLGVEKALLITADGHVVSADGAADGLDRSTVRALQGDVDTTRVLPIGGWPCEIVSSPIVPGSNAGWVVFAARLDRKQMNALQSMAAIPLRASVAYRLAPGVWRDNSGASGGRVEASVARFLEAAILRPSSPPDLLGSGQGKAMAVATRLDSLAPNRPTVLLLQYPLVKAMAPYRLLFALLLGAGALGFCVLLAGAWALARSVTRPISALEQATGRLSRGERARVEVQTRDEIGRLAESFNSMAAEIHQREHELESARDEAQASNRAKSTFLANMGHEVRTPLNGVIGLAGVLAGTRLDAEQQQMLATIQSSAAVLQRLLDDVLDLAEVEAGAMRIVEDDFDLGAAISAVAQAAAVQCRAKGLAFTLAMDESVDVAVNGDRVRLGQILGNLLDNAVKFTDTGGVTLSAVRGSDGVRLEVRDTGVGFDLATAAQLFRPFHQADGSLARRYGGAGLGLGLSRELARAMGGDLGAAAAPGAGAVFTLVLPLPLAKIVPGGAAPAPVEDGAPLRALVVDDHEANRTVARLILESAGLQVVCAEDGAEAARAVAGERFDVVFMDMQMPVMDGLCAIRAIRENERAAQAPRTPILMLSANVLPEHVEAARVAGADGHVAKPVTPPRLIAAVEQALNPAGDGGLRDAAA